MPVVGNRMGNTTDGICQVGDIGANMSVTARHHLAQPPVVVGNDKRQSVKFPRYPDRALLSPFHQIAYLFGLSQRECSKFVFLFLAGDAVLRYLLRGRVGQGSACLCFQPFQLIETGVPFIVGHALGLSVVVGVRSLVQLADELSHA